MTVSQSHILTNVKGSNILGWDILKSIKSDSGKKVKWLVLSINN